MSSRLLSIRCSFESLLKWILGYSQIIEQANLIAVPEKLGRRRGLICKIILSITISQHFSTWGSLLHLLFYKLVLLSCLWVIKGRARAINQIIIGLITYRKFSDNRLSKIIIIIFDYHQNNKSYWIFKNNFWFVLNKIINVLSNSMQSNIINIINYNRYLICDTPPMIDNGFCDRFLAWKL